MGPRMEVWPKDGSCVEGVELRFNELKWDKGTGRGPVDVWWKEADGQKVPVRVTWEGEGGPWREGPVSVRVLGPRGARKEAVWWRLVGEAYGLAALVGEGVDRWDRLAQVGRELCSD